MKTCSLDLYAFVFMVVFFVAGVYLRWYLLTFDYSEKITGDEKRYIHFRIALIISYLLILIPAIFIIVSIKHNYLIW